ncbi:MCE family protein [Nitrogeniibacter mangrovi]|uniref:MCE family protein n=1 Tax=Nitrogeniibacter mangrovi TaxID=2016596 RepID=A0A6C1B3E7_9RHOO|nr:MlaD family protein [Nitrogeniibacter mangrovi]QID17509.1 MCE family protein [Nitrogeniibacter mangrovi]
MENRAHAILAGLFVVVLGIATAVALWWFSGAREPMREVELVSQGNVTGLNLQAAVRYRGISAGRVEEIVIDPTDPRDIVVRISLRKDLPLTRGTTASLGYQGVTGLAFVQLEDRGEDLRPLEAAPGALPRIALAPSLMDELSNVALDAMAQFKTVAQQFKQLFADENVARMGEALKRLESAARGMDRTFNEAPAMIASVRKMFSPENQARIATAMAHLEQASGEAGPAIGEFRALLVKLRETSEHIDQASVAAGNDLLNGSLPRLNTLMKELTVTSQRLTRLIEEVDAAPQMLLLGRGTQPPGPGEEGFDGAGKQ